ncbi:transcriptional regulator [Microbacterium nanhaiense]|uniref:Transcriptional regulator n=1 Tax=Microbacterium nanhaiense TaxID=1301026 RepID=A0ABQ2N258_9MICO|nr:ROK family transcriptional regulator [Microbacterium nanhaiense]GGO63288.1 transcriptional regulator [Microbacterium nanhaiense]
MSRTSSSAAENQVLAVIGSGRARSRREISSILGLSASTVSQHVQSLLAQGLIAEGEARGSTGGRRARELQLAGETDRLGAIDLGGGHARLAVLPRGGALGETSEITVDLRVGAEAVLERCIEEIRSLAKGQTLAGIGVALPGPVDPETHGVVSPSRMPGWAGRDIAALVERLTGAPAVVENDANAMALGEHFARTPHADSSVTVKAGTAIGSGIVIGGSVYRGAGGVAGDITHTRVAAAHQFPCSCGNLGCLETVSSGAALVRLLQNEGVEVATTQEVLSLVRDGHPRATALARSAGHHLGEVLCAVVNFFNPSAIYLGGSLSSLEPFVSALRSEIYEGSHPLMTRDLTIAPAALGADASLVGVSRQINEHLARLTRG